jgi:thiamine-monophosphate kinase
MKEFQIIEKYLKPLTNKVKAAQNLDDDVARFSIKSGDELVVSKDMMIEDVHFLLQDGAFKIASKLLLSNLSDLAASGAKPLYYMLGISKNNNLDENFYKEFTHALKALQDKFKIYLIGGDTVSSDKLAFSITIFGTVKKNQILLRSQAKNRDLIFVSGSIGDAGLGRLNPKSFNQDRHFFPQPKVEFAYALAKNKLSKCAIDVSDGLFADLNHLCESSKLDAVIHLDKIPISLEAQVFLQKNPQMNILDLFSFGDDYEIIFSVNPINENKVINLAKKFNLEISKVGFFKKSLTRKNQIELLDNKNKKIKITKFGYEH